MRLRMWTYDLAREQSPTLDHLRKFSELSLESGYNGFGLYLEHRFAYPSTPWSHGSGSVTPEMVQAVQAEFSELQIVPFLNLLGHMEGMLYTEQGRKYAESKFQGMQACPSNPATQELAMGIIEDALSIFTSPIVHLGGDETWQLGYCAECLQREFQKAPSENPVDGYKGYDHKAEIYADYFQPLLNRLISAERRPALWGDMLLEHESALKKIPKETLIFDWQYFRSPARSSRKFRERGLDVVCCPTLQTYNALWMHLESSEKNILQHAEAAASLGAYGLCLTTWEEALFGNYETLFPAIRGAGQIFTEAGNLEPEDDTEKLVALAEGKDFAINRKGELAEVPVEEEEHHLSLAPGMADDIVKLVLEDKARFARVEPGPREVGIYWEDEEEPVKAGSLPKEFAEGVMGRLRLLAGMKVSGRSVPQEGIIDGIFQGKPFELRCRTKHSEYGMSFLIARPELPPPPSYSGAELLLQAYEQKSPEYRKWAELMGVELERIGGIFAHSRTRSSLKVRLLLYGNPFLAWLHHGEELTGEHGLEALAVAEKAISVAPDAATRGVGVFLRGAVEFVRFAEQAHQAYAAGLPGAAISALAPCRQIFEDLGKVAKATYLNIGGSQADIERCAVARAYVETVILRIKTYGDGSLGYLPSFEHLTHPKFMPHDQGAWWLINRWANE